MWTSTLDLDPRRVLLTRLLWRIWPGAYFPSFSPLRVRDLSRQALPSANWVRVRNHLAGICGSDLHLISGDGDFQIAPAAIPGHRQSYIGHEVVGEVIEVGEDVKQLHVGDRVALQYTQNCVSSGVQSPCRSCRNGYYNLCECGALPGSQPIGGGWSEEMLLHEQQLFPIPLLTDKQGVMLEPTAVAVHAVLRRLPKPGERVLVIGAGTIGMLVMQIVQALVPHVEISVMARHAFQVEQATRQGAEHIIYPHDSYVGVQHATEGCLYRGVPGNQMLLGGYDVVFDTVGSANTLHDALRWTRAQGTVVLVGVSLHKMHLDLTPIWYQEVDLIGTMGHGMETWPLESSSRRSSFQVADELIARGLIHPEQLITHQYSLRDYRHALRTAFNKAHSRAVKVVFDYALEPTHVVTTVRASARHASGHTPLASGAPARQSLQADVSEFMDSVNLPSARGSRTTGKGTEKVEQIDLGGDQEENAITVTAIMAIEVIPGSTEEEEMSGDTQQVTRITSPEWKRVKPGTDQHDLETSIAIVYTDDDISPKKVQEIQQEEDPQQSEGLLDTSALKLSIIEPAPKIAESGEEVEDSIAEENQISLRDTAESGSKIAEEGEGAKDSVVEEEQIDESDEDESAEEDLDTEGSGDLEAVEVDISVSSQEVRRDNLALENGQYEKGRKKRKGHRARSARAF